MSQAPRQDPVKGIPPHMQATLGEFQGSGINAKQSPFRRSSIFILPTLYKHKIHPSLFDNTFDSVFGSTQKHSMFGHMSRHNLGIQCTVHFEIYLNALWVLLCKPKWHEDQKALHSKMQWIYQRFRFASLLLDGHILLLIGKCRPWIFFSYLNWKATDHKYRESCCGFVPP